MEMSSTQDCSVLAELIDWSEPGLETGMESAAPMEQVLHALRVIRGRGENYFGFDDGYLQRLREMATGAEVERARSRVDKALAGDLFFPPHNNAFAALGAETLALGIDSARAELLAAKVLERQGEWGRNVWCFGITHGVANLLRCLCPLTAVPDSALLPIIGWLCAIAPVENRSARGWGERTLGTSGHNWYIHSLYGLWMAGRLFGVFRNLQPFRALAPTYLEREVSLLFAEDGWSREGAAGYHAFAFSNVMAFWLLAQRHGVTFSADFSAKMKTIADATWRMQGSDGDGPLFGDSSASAGGAAWKPTVFAESGYGQVTRCLAARFALSRAKGAVEVLEPGVPPGFLPDHGEDLAAAYGVLLAEEPELDTALRASGLYAMRSSWGPDGEWMAINAMPIGPTVSSHKHADLLNLELCVRGRRVLVDNWYGDVTADDGSYQSIPEIRNDPMKRRWRVGSSAHNVTTVDGEDIVPVVQIYRYGWNEAPLVDEWQSAATHCWFSGVHEAYRRLPAPVVAVRRKVFYLRGEYWVVIDRFTNGSEADHLYTQHWHLLSAVLAGGGVRSSGAGGNVLLAPVAGLTGEVAVEPCPHPISSYQNPDHMTISATGGDLVMAMVLVPFSDDAVPAARASVVPVFADGEQLSPWEMTGIEIRLADRTDRLVVQHLHMNHPWACGDVQGSGRVWHSRIGEVG